MAVALMCSSTVFTSCSNGDNPSIGPTYEPGSAYRAVLQSLDWGQDTTFVYGHKVTMFAVANGMRY